jgi:hypothetical protein
MPPSTHPPIASGNRQQLSSPPPMMTNGTRMCSTKVHFKYKNSHLF